MTTDQMGSVPHTLHFKSHSTGVAVVIVAGGRGVRAGGDTPKQFVMLGARPMLMQTIDAFVKHCDQIVVVLPSAYIAHWEQLCQDHDYRTVHLIAEGGDERFNSVRAGIKLVAPDIETILIHDGVRPFVSPSLIERVIDGAKDNGAVVPATPITDTLRRVGGGIVSRSEVMAVQTPQGFSADILRRSYSVRFDGSFTDDGSVVEAAGYAVELVEGEIENIKITTPFDLKIANKMMEIVASNK